MRRTKIFTKTSKTTPTDEVAKNAQLLIRAGFIHKEMAGVYAYLPLGLRVLENIKRIVREEMNAVGGHEVMMTALQPRELFEKTNRWDDAVVDNWFKTKLKNGTELGLGLTHEEPITNVLFDSVGSYRDLPVMIYQIQNKFRNEKRAKSGLLRGREFVMKDMYSFARSQAEHEEVYEKVAAAYTRVYERLGIGDITFRTKADGGYFTERYSDEYQTLCDVGEDTLYHVPDTDLWYNEEIAPAHAFRVEQPTEQKPLENVKGEGVVGVAELVKFLNVPIESTTKTMIYEGENGEIIAAAVRGDHDVNETKLRKVVGAKKIKLADENTIRRATGAEVGYAGLLNLPDSVRVVVDESCSDLVNFETGNNRTGEHAVNVNWERDLPTPDQFYDIKTARAGDLHTASGKVYEVHKGVEVGNIFPLESKYTDGLGLYYLDQNGEQQHIVMGCYGIGISRLVGALTEVFADDRGLVWHDNVAPFRVYLAQIGDDENVCRECEKLYQDLQNRGVEVLWDDRPSEIARPGEKFADADLMGIPHRVVISTKTIEQGKIEYKQRTNSAVEMLTPDDLFGKLDGR
ncbi:proline--tRNA ligase [Candidatus Saccharibacteria bacterium]|nr:proline--tRNA ligase [Candidatus Saccharibacteria bacterium]MCL1963177.1 proline--tRNA ligase [Candidatus Saccharibacteria bacterium]